MGKLDKTLTCKVDDELLDTLGKILNETDKRKSNVIRASLILGFALIAKHHELVDQFGGHDD